MQYFELELQEQINLYIESGITPTELFFIQLLLLASDDYPKYLVNYVSNTSGAKQLFKNTLQSLLDKGVINSTFSIPKDGESLNFKTIPFNKNFIKKYFKEGHLAGKELFDEYPPFISINGKLCSIRNFTKAGLFSLEDFCVYYSKSIKKLKTSHERVMEALRFGKEYGLINYSIKNSSFL